MRRLLPPFFLALPPLLVLMVCRASADLHVTAPRAGRVFFETETVGLGLALDEGRAAIPYVVLDYHGKTVARGSRIVTASRTCELRLGRLARGWYELQLTLPDGSVKKDAFAVLPPMEGQGRRYLLFGVCATLDNQTRADYLSLAGLRVVRRDWGWPTIEPWDDCWAAGYTNDIMTRAQRAGLQFMPIVGYAPRHAGVRPADALSGRPGSAGHTWPIGDLTEWVEFLRWCQDFAGRFPDVAWPPERLAPQAKSRSYLPAVAAWEIWNEADQNFFYGPWHNYCDLLRLAHGVLDTLEAPVVYGGSCGHWTETGMSYSWGLRSFFDLAAGHGGHEADQSLPLWIYGAYSIGYKYGLPYRLCFTEGYFNDEVSGRPFAQYVLPMYGQLLHWGVEQHFRGVGWDSSPTVHRDSGSICHNLPDGLAASPPYVALAFARHLLADASYAGRLTLQPGVTAYVFLREGIPRAILCNSGDRASVSLRVGSTPITSCYDCLGGDLPGTRGDVLSVSLGLEPVVVSGVSWSLVAEAAKARLAEFLDTQFGVRPTSGSSWWCSYLRLLRDDLKRLAPAAVSTAEQSAQRAVEDLGRNGRRARPSVARAAGDLQGLLLALAPSRTETRPLASLFNTYWRALGLSEWFTELADAVGDFRGGETVSEEDLKDVRNEVLRAWNVAVARGRGFVKPSARSLVRRAWTTHRMVSASQGPLLCRLVGTEVVVARAWAALEDPVYTNLLGLAQFPTAPFLVKAHLIEPGRTHTVQPLFLNMTPRAAKATIQLRFPAGWEPETASVACSAPPYSIVRAPEVSVTLSGARPWISKRSWRPSTPLEIFAPQQLPPEQQVEVWAESDGARSPSCFYLLNVGSLEMPELPPEPPEL